MTAPGGGFGESAHDDEVNPPAGSGGWQQPDWQPTWEPPAPPAASPPPAYPPPGFPPGHPAGYAGHYPPPVPPYQPGPFGGPPGGYGPPAYQGSYYPGPNYQPGYGPAGAMHPGTNGLAIASLVASFTGLFCCIGSIVAIVLGIIALEQTKRNRQEGYGLAVAGIVIGIAALVVNVIIVYFALHGASGDHFSAA